MNRYWVYMVGIDLNEIVAKANEQISPKIMCTYDMLPRITELLDTSKYRLLVDESHKLFQDYSFRKDACNGVLDSYKKYSNYTFATATPGSAVYIVSNYQKI